MTFGIIGRDALDRLAPTVSAPGAYAATRDGLIRGLAQGAVAALTIIVNSGKSAEKFIGSTVLFDDKNDVSNRARILTVGGTEKEENNCQQPINRGLDRVASKRSESDVCAAYQRLHLRRRQCHQDQLQVQPPGQ